MTETLSVPEAEYNSQPQLVRGALSSLPALRNRGSLTLLHCNVLATTERRFGTYIKRTGGESARDDCKRRSPRAPLSTRSRHRLSNTCKIPLDMSPTCTIPYEVLVEFTNTTPDAVTMQVLRREDGGRAQAGPVIYLHQGESLSLVLTAGMAYKYAVRQPPREAELS